MKNIGSFLAFNKDWFARNQRILLFFINNFFFRRWFRWILRIRKFDCSIKKKIIQLGPHYFTIHAGGDQVTTDFRTHPKFAKRIYFAFKYVWWFLHFIDWLFLDRFVPKLSFGFVTLTYYPDAGSGGTTVDGYVYRYIDENFLTLRNGAGTSASTTGSTSDLIRLWSSYTTNQWFHLSRSMFTFDTTLILTTATITAATISFYVTAKYDSSGIAPDIICSGVEAGHRLNSSNNLIPSDYEGAGLNNYFINYTPISYASISAAYNDIVFEVGELHRIFKEDISEFIIKNHNYDASYVAPAWYANRISYIRAYFADNTGTVADPKLVITYTGFVAINIDESLSLNDTVVGNKAIIILEILSLTSSCATILTVCAKKIRDMISVWNKTKNTTNKNKP